MTAAPYQDGPAGGASGLVRANGSPMKIQDLLNQIITNPQCKVHPMQGFPPVKDKHVLPNDVLEFYSLCGGVDLFTKADYPYSIVPANKFVRANPIIAGEDWSDSVWETDVSADWYIVASDPDSQYLTIDLNPQRLGRCYDSFIGHHANPGYCPIIAISFMDLLHRLIQSQGQYPYWLEQSFSSLGDAYDN
jgi:antitoxin YokJ